MTVCQCGTIFRTDRVGMTFLERASGTPHALWSCDRLLCPKCGNHAYVTANEPMAVQHEKIFEVNMHAARQMGILVDGSV
jgi:hypothetical protein